MHYEQLTVDGPIMDEHLHLGVPRPFEGEHISRATSFRIKNALFQN
jgi:hypothetical protein